MNRSIMALSAVAALVPAWPAGAQQARVEQLDDRVDVGQSLDDRLLDGALARRDAAELALDAPAIDRERAVRADQGVVGQRHHG